MHCSTSKACSSPPMITPVMLGASSTLRTLSRTRPGVGRVVGPMATRKRAAAGDKQADDVPYTNSPRKTVTACPIKTTRFPSTRILTTPPRQETWCAVSEDRSSFCANRDQGNDAPSRRRDLHRRRLTERKTGIRGHSLSSWNGSSRSRHGPGTARAGGCRGAARGLGPRFRARPRGPSDCGRRTGGVPPSCRAQLGELGWVRDRLLNRLGGEIEARFRVRSSGVSRKLEARWKYPSSLSVPVSCTSTSVRMGRASKRMPHWFSDSSQSAKSASVKANAFFTWPSLKLIRPLEAFT